VQVGTVLACMGDGTFYVRRLVSGVEKQKSRNLLLRDFSWCATD